MTFSASHDSTAVVAREQFCCDRLSTRVIANQYFKGLKLRTLMSKVKTLHWCQLISLWQRWNHVDFGLVLAHFRLAGPSGYGILEIEGFSPFIMNVTPWIKDLFLNIILQHIIHDDFQFWHDETCVFVVTFSSTVVRQVGCWVLTQHSAPNLSH